MGERSEFGLIAGFRETFGAAPEGETWSGDDAAVLAPPGGPLSFAVDGLVEGTDFEWGWASPEDVGWKALAVNLSDLAAMGATPWRAVAYLAVTPGTSDDVAIGIAEGMASCASTYRVGVAGGDLGSAGEVSVVVTVLGTHEGAPVLRSGARVGDAICVTGVLGGARAGLEALRAGAGRDRAGRQLRPRPRVREGLVLAGAGASAAIDVSDGFVADLLHLLAASGVGCDLDPAAVPVDPLAVEVDAGSAPGWALAGGEDYELVFTIAEAAMPDVRDKLGSLGCPVTRVGTVTPHGEMRAGGLDLEELRSRSWDHLRGR